MWVLDGTDYAIFLLASFFTEKQLSVRIGHETDWTNSRSA
jgi:hypothetical protein